MKKIIILMSLLLSFSLFSCSKSDEVAAYNVGGNTYVWEKEGFGGDFTITLNEDGTYEYYVGYLSSYIGMGNWEVRNDVLTLTESGGYDITFLFTVKEKEIVYIADGSDEFAYVTVENGDRFILKEGSERARDEIEHVGTLPSEFQKIVSENRFYGITAFADRLLVSRCVSVDNDAHSAEYRIDMMDLYGEVTASCSYKTSDAHKIGTLTATDDGGFLFAACFKDKWYGDDSWAGDFGVTSYVVKCDKTGSIQWTAPLDDYSGRALEFCFECGDCYCFFGDNQDAKTKVRGVYSLTDITITVIDAGGRIIRSDCIGGSDFDNLENAEKTESGFLLSIRSQSDEGDFEGSDSGGYPVDWTFELNSDFEIVDKRKTSGRDYFDKKLGEKENGEVIYSGNSMFDGFDAGRPCAYIDYGDFYLIVSERETGSYERTPAVISSIWYYTETVYSAYEWSGKLIFRSSVDSSPDYDLIAGRFNPDSRAAQSEP